MLFTDCVERYLLHLQSKNKSPQTINGYKKDYRYFNTFLEERYNGVVYIDEITHEDLENYQVYLSFEKKLKPRSVNRYLSSVRSLFEYAMKKDWIEKNVTKNLDNVSVPVKERSYLNHDELERLFEAIDHDVIKTTIITMAYTGLRISEAVNLTLDAVKLDEQYIRCLGKGNKERHIPISGKLLPILRDYLEYVREASSEYFFATSKTGSLSAVYVNRVLHQAADKIGLQKRVSAHILRHSFATNLVHKNVNIVDLQRLLGHSSLRTTSIYVHTNQERLKSAVDLL
ncbi:tyrosine-type recombinase/integrase [Bacillus tianshenii]|nr:tyrosine-type recombinase/integrase [Bacillus tianshenii]